MGEMENKAPKGENETAGRKFGLRFVWGLFMVFAYIGIAYLVFFTPVLLRYNAENDPANDQNLVARIFLGSVLLVYGVFRGYRFYKYRR